VTPSLDEVFGALADPTRRAVVARLAKGPSTVKALAEPFAMALPSFSKHLKVLEGAGLIAREVEGRYHTVWLVPETLRLAIRSLEELVDDAPQPLKSFLASIPLPPAPVAASGVLAKAEALVAELRPRMAMIASALEAPPRSAGVFSPQAHRARLLALEVAADAGLRQELAAACACFERLELALVAARAGDSSALEAATLPIGHLAFACQRHPLLAELSVS
jgi:DNA-binding transcriptional ArsR family regulator